MKHGPKVGKWTKKSLAEYICVGGLGFTPVGTAELVADEMEQWIAEADVDGFNIVSFGDKLCAHEWTDPFIGLRNSTTNI